MKSTYTEEYARSVSFLLEARKKQGLTQVELAEVLARPQSFVSKFENCERRLDVVEFLAVAAALNIDANEIVSEFSTVLSEKKNGKQN